MYTFKFYNLLSLQMDDNMLDDEGNMQPSTYSNTKDRPRNSFDTMQQQPNLIYPSAPVFTDEEFEPDCGYSTDQHGYYTAPIPRGPVGCLLDSDVDSMGDVSSDGGISGSSEERNNADESECVTEQESARTGRDDDYSDNELSMQLCYKLAVAIIILIPIAIAFLLAQGFDLQSFGNFFYSNSAGQLIDGELQLFDGILISDQKKLELKQNILSKLREKSESDPLSVYIMTSSEHQEKVENFAQSLAYIFAKHIHNPGMIEGVLPPDTLETYNIDILEDEISNKYSTLVLPQFHLLSWDAAKIFMQFCDNENAPYKDRMFIFTSTVDECNKHKPDESVENFLKSAWSGSADEDTIEALVVRISSISICIS